MVLDRRQFERAVLEEVIELHPVALTISTLIEKMAGGEEEVIALWEAMRGLRHADLLIFNDEAVSPTRAALHAAELFTGKRRPTQG